jgi:hypothetical protein
MGKLGAIIPVDVRRNPELRRVFPILFLVFFFFKALT